jgi:phenylacetate-CoA ligase
MASVFDRIYAKSPVWLQNLGISMYGLMWRHRRYGGGFSRYVSQFAERESFSAEQWRDYQTEQLRLLLLNANCHVPYYKELFARLNLSDADLAHFTLDDLSKLPILEKEQIRDHPELFVANNIPLKRLNKYYTSGTTGTPLAIMSTTDTDRKNQAVSEVRARRWAGLNNTMSRAMLGGRLVVPRGNAHPPFWRYNIFERQLYFSAFHIASAYISDYVQALNRFQPDYLVGYASSQYFLARMIAEQGFHVYQPKAVLTSSENLTPEMRKTISEVYNCPVFDGYSGVEACCTISECEYHTMHESPDMGIIELINNSGLHAKTGEPGEIIATGLLNFEQPLIRYRTGDIAIRAEHGCECGRQMPVFHELVGRLEDTVVGVDGREMVRFHGIFVGLSHVREGQIIQKTLTDFQVRLVVDQNFSDTDKEEIYHRFQIRLGQVNLEFEFVDKIERTLGGKFRAVISKVQRNPERK